MNAECQNWEKEKLLEGLLAMCQFVGDEKESNQSREKFLSFLSTLSICQLDAIKMSVLLYHQQSLCLASWAERHNLSRRSLEELRWRWLFAKDGAGRFLSEGYNHTLLEAFSSKEIKEAKFLAQVILLHDPTHVYLVSCLRKCPSSELREAHLTQGRDMNEELDYSMMSLMSLGLSLLGYESFRDFVFEEGIREIRKLREQGVCRWL